MYEKCHGMFMCGDETERLENWGKNKNKIRQM